MVQESIPSHCIFSYLLLLSRFSHVQLFNPIDGSQRGSHVPGILQARPLEWVAISFSNAWKWKWSRSVVSNSSGPHALQPTRFLHPWDFPGKSTGVGCHCLLELHYYNHWSYIELYILSTASSLGIIFVEGSVIYLVIQEIIILWNKQNTNGIVNNISGIKSKYFSHEPPIPDFFKDCQD